MRAAKKDARLYLAAQPAPRLWLAAPPRVDEARVGELSKSLWLPINPPKRLYVKR